MPGISVGLKSRYISHKALREKELIDNLFRGVTRAMLIVERQAKINVDKSPPYHPQVQTDRLRSSITHEQAKLEGSRGVGRVGTKVGTNVDYGYYLEFGTKLESGMVRMPAYPWLFPALEEKKDEVREALKG